jgi:hypothetical protein
LPFNAPVMFQKLISHQQQLKTMLIKSRQHELHLCRQNLSTSKGNNTVWGNSKQGLHVSQVNTIWR